MILPIFEAPGFVYISREELIEFAESQKNRDIQARIKEFETNRSKSQMMKQLGIC